MPHSLFISDLHLEPGRPDITEQFLAFLSGPARQAERLFILGDLFEVWLGDDAASGFELGIAEALNRLNQSGVPIDFIHGNRDFLLGEDFCRRAGMRKLSEPERIDLYDVPTVLLHGDILCTADQSYQRFRQRVQNPSWQQKMLSRPIWFRRCTAGLLRHISRQRTRSKPEKIMDVTEAAVIEAFEKNQVRRMIHGHTHRPDIHRHGPAERIVLGDWHKQASVLRVDAEGFELTALAR
ncbi:MAG: UDP-2,3-diacylglucosamine diphosphatase [Pseudomonadota bacterium]